MRVLVLYLAIAGVAAGYGQQRPDLPMGVTPLPPTLKGPSFPGDAMGYTVEVSITGSVLLDNRHPPPEPVQVDYACRGKSLAAVTDAKGRFSVPVGRQQLARNGLLNLPMLEGCRVQVSVPGFEDITVSLKRPQTVSDMNLGDLVLQSKKRPGDRTVQYRERQGSE